MLAMGRFARQEISPGVFSPQALGRAAVSEKSPEEEDDVAAQIVRLRPRLVGFAWSLTRDRDMAEDLAQETIARAIARSGDFSLARISKPGSFESCATSTSTWFVPLGLNRRSSRSKNSLEKGSHTGGTGIR